MQTCRETYDELRDWYLAICHMLNLEDDYEGQNKKMRYANLYAVKETICVWQITNSEAGDCLGRCGYNCERLRKD